MNIFFNCEVPLAFLSRSDRNYHGISVLLLLLLVVAVSGCKIEIVTPEGGAVTSRTGTHDCYEASICEIDIEEGTEFSDTFTAVPKEGYKFYGWREAQGALCGNTRRECALEGIPGELTQLDVTLKLSPIIGPELRNDITLNPLPDSVLLKPTGFSVSEILKYQNSNSMVWYFGSGDLDSDGNPEILLSGWTLGGDFRSPPSAYPADLLILEANPGETVQLPPKELLGRSQTFGTTFIRFEDFDLNGEQDVLITGHNEKPFQFTPNLLFLNHGGVFTETRIEPEMAMHEGSIGDFNNDGYPDFVGSAYMADIPVNPEDPYSGEQALMLFVNDRKGGFEPYALRYTIATNGISANEFVARGGDWISRGSAAAIGNLDKDSDTEIIVVDGPNTEGSENVMIDNIRFEQGLAYGEKKALPGSYFAKNPHFDGNPFLPTGGFDMSHEVQVELFDFDNDGDLDVLISAMIWVDFNHQTSAAGVLQFLANDGNGNFQDVTESTLYNYNLGNNSSHDMAIMDVNHDGYKDIVLPGGGYYKPVASPRWDGQIWQTIPYTWGNEILINAGNGKFVSTFWTGFNELTQLQEQIYKQYGTKYQPYSLNDYPYFPYMLADGRLGFVTFGDGHPSTVFVFDVRSKLPLSTGPRGTDPAKRGAPGFSEYYYLTENPDVVQAITKGQYKSGLEHYLSVGRDQGRPGSAREASDS